ncbi:LuxR C-terminal-related transcriptional regulator [Tessaracoccus sp. OS52]|uniref:LuxR C-terminal-related transcriptional regulator n=1 Tax=Tessaracoccus sp. OS52 TaxID=2886691 RepID=UPI001D10E6C0|nr:LuxR C-terminal-related transcriptional regulator [Tessaracoccus sp. OS52]MCC2593969.1 LuxR C-terminal-related transcriptional regulator [Tessaracoccus sp. OS52]
MQPEHRDLASLDTLSRVADGLAGEFRLEPLLELILRSSVGLLGCESGSLCLVDQSTGTYRKHIDMQAGCQAGQVFPLEEGVTGAVARAGQPVIFRHYADVPGGHVAAGSPLYDRAVLGVPIRLRSDLIGSLVVFAADDERAFADDDAQLLQRFATHAAIAMANAGLHAEAAERAKASAVWAERERSMVDLHDALARGLATALLQLERATELARQGEPVAALLQEVRGTVESVLSDGRRALWGLPEDTEGRNVEESLALELEWTEAIAGVSTSFRTFGDPQPLRPEVAAQLIRIAKESLTNVAQHAAASTVRLGLVYMTDAVAVIVEDDGCGFDPGAHHASGVGLAGLVARATQVGGRVHIDSTPGWGTRVRADLPYRGTADDVADAPRLRVVVIHDQPAMRAGIVRLLSHSEPGVQVVAEIGEAGAAAEAVRLLHPTVVLVGSRVARGDADLVAELRDVAPEVPVVVLLDEDADHTMREFASAGVRGIIPLTADATALGRAVVAAAQGDVLVFSGILQQLDPGPGAGVQTRLTSREQEVLQLIREGLADKQIASRLGIAVKTVEKHVGSVLRKHGVHSRTELIAQTSQAT